MQLWLTREQALTIFQQAIETSPQEICGLIAGIGAKAYSVIPISNIAHEPHQNFYMKPTELLRALKTIEKDGLSLIGIYHSHPKTDPIPSQTDIHDAQFPWTAYLIVSLKYSQPRFKAWHIHDARVEPVELTIGHQAPAPEEPPLSSTQKVAIILGAILALIIMLALSLSLLPPAPPLPTPIGG